MRKISLILLACLFLISFVSAQGVEHGISGYVADAADETQANDAVVVFYIEGRENEILTDIVGPSGNSIEDNWYSIDIKNFKTPWQNKDILIIKIIKDELHAAETQIIVDSSGGVDEQQAPNIILGQCEGTVCSYCGDLICNEACNETIFTCPQDCGGMFCGDDACLMDEKGRFENFINCPEDCPEPVCGDGLCEFGENQVNCKEDCALGCNFNGVCDFGESFDSCPGDCLLENCGNIICEPEFDENDNTCPSDCPPVVCGDGICEAGEGENADNCPADCKRIRCGNKICEPGETKKNCCLDCGCETGECKKNKCVVCEFIGITGSFIGICWYLWVIIILGLVAGYFILRQRIIKTRRTRSPKYFFKVQKAQKK